MQTLNVILAVLAGAGLLAGLPQIWGSNWKQIWRYRIRGLLSWDTVWEAGLAVVQQLAAGSFRPTVILGVGRGGMIAAGLVCSELTGEQLAEDSESPAAQVRSSSIKLEVLNTTVSLRLSDPAEELARRSVTTPVVDSVDIAELDTVFVSDDRVLIICAQSFHGSTLINAARLVETAGISRANIRTATLFLHRHASIDVEHHPHYIGREVPINKTVPWKRHRVTTDRF